MQILYLGYHGPLMQKTGSGARNIPRYPTFLLAQEELN
jgi:hypothetical protein